VQVSNLCISTSVLVSEMTYNVSSGTLNSTIPYVLVLGLHVQKQQDTINVASSHLFFCVHYLNVSGKQKGIVANDASYHSKWFLVHFLLKFFYNKKRSKIKKVKNVKKT